MASMAVQLLGPSTGGIRAHVGELARRLADLAWDTFVVGPAAVMDGVGRQDGVVEVPRGWNPLTLRTARRQLRQHLDLLGPDRVALVHAHGLKAALVVESLRSHPPVVVTVHNLTAGTHRGVAARVLGIVERAVLRRADHVIVISDEIAAHLAGVVPDGRQTFVLPAAPHRSVTEPADSVRRRYGIADDAPLVVVVARHHPQKDLPMFLRAMGIVVGTMPDARAVIVGDGPERARVEAERTRLGLEHVVTVAGHRPNPVDEMHAADVVAVSSRWEGSPLVVAECLGLGRPLVSTDVGTVTRHLTDGVDARLVAVGDADAFAAALLDLLGDPARATLLGERGRAVAQATFNPAQLVEQIAAVYTEVEARISRRPGRLRARRTSRPWPRRARS